MSKISVIVPVYNVEQYLARCVDSVLSQTFADFELILVDDGSPDNCPQMCDEYAAKDSRVVVIHQANGGLSAARNAGIDWAFEHSDSEWLTFMDSDDWVHPEYLERLYHAAIDNNVSVSKCQLITVGSRDDVPVGSISNAKLLRMDEEYLVGNSTVCAVTRLYAKEAFKQIRFPVGKLHEDLFIMHQLMFQYDQIALIPTPMYYYFCNTESITKGCWSKKRLEEFKAYDLQLDFFKKCGLNEVYNRVLRYRITSIVAQYELLKKSCVKRKAWYLLVLKYEMICSLMKSKNIATTIWRTDKRQYEVVFPKYMWLYWTCKAIIKGQ